MRQRDRQALIVVVCVSVLVLSFLPGCGSGLEVVTLDSGQVSGRQAAGVWQFLGIPYARPPVGALRWKPPQPPVRWTGVKDCMLPGPSCPQPPSAMNVGRTAEDCLYLNVWSPALSSDERLPVMVWIHGGGFAYGAGSQPDYAPQNLCRLGVVVVSINYRLGPFGFMAHPLLSKESPRGVSGNYGLLDQVQALKWVRKNIAGFGGDKGRVTVFGESAGGQSVNALMVSPLSGGLFQRAISQSGPLWDRGLRYADVVPLADGEATGEQFAAKLGAPSLTATPGLDPVAVMRTKTPEQLLQAWGFSEGQLAMPDGIQFLPVIDRWFLPDRPEKLFEQGKQHAVPVIAGSNKDDGTMFGGLAVEKGTTATQYAARIQAGYGADAQELLNAYPAPTDPAVGPALSNLLTQTEFAAFQRLVVASAEKRREKGYLYQFTRTPPTATGKLLGAYHGAETPYVFGHLDPAAGYTEEDQYLSKVMMNYWTRFAETGDPNGGGQANWPAYSGTTDENLSLDAPVSVNAALLKQACDMADRIYLGEQQGK
jgi:para-nitrobenzyl esterase